MWSYLHKVRQSIKKSQSFSQTARQTVGPRGQWGQVGLPAPLSVGADPPLVELADGGGFAAAGVVGEEAAAALATHSVQEVPATQRTGHPGGTPLKQHTTAGGGRGLGPDAAGHRSGERGKDSSFARKLTPPLASPSLEPARTLKVRKTSTGPLEPSGA